MTAIRGIRQAAAMGALACLWLLPASCDRNAESEEAAVSGSAGLSVILSIPASAESTKADDGYEAGTSYENRINVTGGDYRFYFFDTETTEFIAKFEPESLVKTTESDGSAVYYVTGEVPAELLSYKDFTLAVIANWGNEYQDSDFSDIDGLCSAEWSQFECWGTDEAEDFDLESSGKAIPFYGVHTYEDVEFQKDVLTPLEDPVTLLRAMAKVEVLVNPDDDALELSGVALRHYNSKGYCAPYGVYSQDDYGQGSDWDTDYLDGSLYLVGAKNDDDNSGADEANRKIQFWHDTANGKWVAYIPEYDNSGDDFAYIEATFTHQGSSEEPYAVYFANYTSGKTDNDVANRLNIERNNLYRFTLSMNPLLFKVTVAPYELGGKVHIEL